MKVNSGGRIQCNFFLVIVIESTSVFRVNVKPLARMNNQSKFIHQ